MKTPAVWAALVAISSPAGAAEKPITLTCSGTWKSEGPLLGKRDGSVDGMRITIDLNTRTIAFDNGVVGADMDVKHVTRATKARIEYGGETVKQGGTLNERGVLDRTTGAFPVGWENSAGRQVCLEFGLDLLWRWPAAAAQVTPFNHRAHGDPEKFGRLYRRISMPTDLLIHKPL
jgi:hypothetical protein